MPLVTSDVDLTDFKFMPLEVARMRRGFSRFEHVRIAGDHAFIHTNPIDTSAAMRRFLHALEETEGASNAS